VAGPAWPAKGVWLFVGTWHKACVRARQVQGRCREPRQTPGVMEQLAFFWGCAGRHTVERLPAAACTWL
jgi:hypothetical protein